MGLEHVGIGEERLVGRHQRQLAPVGELHERRLDLAFGLQAVAHQLDVKPPRKQPGEPLQHLLRHPSPALGEQPSHRARRAAGERDQPFAVRLEIGERQLRGLRRGGLKEGTAHQLHQIAVALLALDQDHQDVRREPRAVARVRALSRGPVLQTRVRVAADGELAADDRLHAGLRAGQRKLHGAEQVGGVGDGHGRHGVGPAQRHQLVDLDGALGQRIGGMDP